MVFGKTAYEIVKLAVENQSTHFDGVVQYNYNDDKIYGCSMSTGETENPANPVIEIFRLPQGESGEIDCRCWESSECPYWVEDENDYIGGHFNENLIINNMYRQICCIDAYVDDDFDYDWEMNYREGVEEQVRDILSDYLGEIISKLNDIRIGISDIIAPYDYVKVRNDNWEMNVLDTYVDNAIENGFSINGDPEGWLDAEIQHLAGVQYKDEPFWQEVGYLIENCKFDKALELLQ